MARRKGIAVGRHQLYLIVYDVIAMGVKDGAQYYGLTRVSRKGESGGYMHVSVTRAWHAMTSTRAAPDTGSFAF